MSARGISPAITQARTQSCQARKSLESVLDTPDIDIVDICSPDSLHARQSLVTLKTSRHVLCEKPIVMDPEEAEAIVPEAEVSWGLFIVGQVLLFFPEYEWIRDYLRRGELGALLCTSPRRSLES